MSDYEIRICRPAAPASLIWASQHPSTYAALVKARTLAGEGGVVEVWRGDECVHRETIAAP